MELHRDERGLKGIELGMALLMIGILATLAIPLATQIGDQVREVASAADARTAQIVAAGEGTLDAGEVRVAGVQLERAADGATCRWTQSGAGTVFGVWESGSRSLYGTFTVRPDVCPTAGEAEAAGFGPSFVGP